MSSPRTSIPDAVRSTQARAADPASSVFVSANAGSGKTHVLVQRVIRLLLSGVPPERILCITFTKAAAANMAERVFTTLGRWVTLEDSTLDAAIRDVGIATPTPKLRMRARELFACALETPGGLKVQTIHALCTRLLQQFPFEANVPAHFAVLDDRDQTEMMERANLKVLLDAARQPESVAGRALDTAMSSAADVTFKEVVRDACLSREHFMAWADHAGDLSTAIADVCAALGVDPAERLIDLERDIVEGPYLPRSKWNNVASILDGSGKSDRDQAERLREAIAFSGIDQVEAYLGVFLTDALAPRKSIVTKKFGDTHPDIAQTFDQESRRVAPLIERRRLLTIRDRTESLLVIATAAAAHYRREKQERGLLDYDDLIDKTLAMLDRVSSGWVHFKLDRGIDHVLIDEAQDTSPRQWDIVSHLISEFTSGEGSRDGVKRTIFAVGDEKQSIFSFQGAVPREFDDRRRLLEKKFTDARLKFEKLAFKHSFRSGPAILQTVDRVFRDEAIYRSIHAENAYPLHESLTDAGPSQIDLWDLLVPEPKQDMEGWRTPFDGMSKTSPEVRLANRIQAEIAALVNGKTLTGGIGRRRPLRYGDVLILVRRRGNAFDAVIQALRHANLPVAGADRLKLTEHIAVIDLMNLADALLLPLDDLALATALKSPLFGLTEDDLFALAFKRAGSLRASLQTHATKNPRLDQVLRRLRACEDRFATETPFAFYAWLLGGQGPEPSGRARILRRLGHEANDALDEFLELALNYERKAPASLQGFMAWLRAADTEVKRDMEISRDEVRVMTVHGAKGLEAPVVFLVDTTTSPMDTTRLRLIRLPRGNAAPTSPGVTVWAGKKAEDPAAVAAARASMLSETEDEYRRLLYVAMTRAADRLIVAGCMPGNRRELRELSWYDLIARAMPESGLTLQEIDTPLGKVRRYFRDGDADTSAMASDGEPGGAIPLALPLWLRTPGPRDARPDDRLRPSQSGGDDGHRLLAGESLASRASALLRGSLVHRLLQSLPDLPAAQRTDAGMRYLARNAGAWSEDERTALVAQVMSLIARHDVAALFATGSRAEVPIVGRLMRDGHPLLVDGQIDRLVVTPAEVLIVDYKTNHAPPRTPSEAPRAYVRQLALYRAVLAKLYPGLPVRAALLWTETPEIMEIPARMLDAAVTDIISK